MKRERIITALNHKESQRGPAISLDLRGRLFALQGATQNEIYEYQKALKFYPEDKDSQYWLKMAKYKLLQNKKIEEKIDCSS